MGNYIEELLKPRILLDPEPSGSVRRITESLPRIKALVFDIYGTLLVSGSGDVGSAVERSSAAAFGAAVSAAGMPDPSDEICRTASDLFFEAIRKSHSRSMSAGIDYPEVDIRKIWHTVLSELPLKVQAPFHARLDNERASAAYESSVNPVWPMPGFPEILQAASSRGIKLGIVSNAQFYTPLVIKACTGKTPVELGFLPDLCIYSYEEGRAKPSPVLFEKLAAGLCSYGINPSQALYVGNDMLNDIYPAAAAGFITALFAGDRRSLRLRKEHPACKGLQPDAIVLDLEDLKIFF